MKKLLIVVMAFSLGFAGCRKEANQVVSRPLNEVQGSLVASPSPSPSPTAEVVVDGEGDGRVHGWKKVVGGGVLVIGTIALIVYGIYRWRHRAAAAGVVHDFTVYMINEELFEDAGREVAGVLRAERLRAFHRQIIDEGAAAVAARRNG
jgi:hypothetical protein